MVNVLDEAKLMIDMSYLENVERLLGKYGAVTDDYFRESSYWRFFNNKIQTIAKGKTSRTSEGLYVHHIDEYEYANLGNRFYIRFYGYPFDTQKADRLVYANLLEHLVLHLLIAVETNGEFGLAGYRLLRKDIIAWYIHGNEPTVAWMRIAMAAVKLTASEATEAINFFDRILSDRLQPITEEEIAIRENERWTRRHPELVALRIRNDTSRDRVLSQYYKYVNHKTYPTFEKFESAMLTMTGPRLLTSFTKLLRDRVKP
ncbi:hypothetical protein EFL45_00545 [Weissella confusa]|uniref:hypothetical protein n=1 Tax=Weissella confusa TaxID=1583 RepID=UPI00223A6A70|nr:hypothetical protein [Weissella confusa]MCT0947961.1 hypothetical protein [Weissella confusa]